MKKYISTIILILALLTLSSITLNAEGKSVSIFGNFGIMAADDFKFDPFLWYFGVNLDLFFSDNLYLSPEANLIMEDFKFETFFLQPAILLNLKLSNLFVGAGIQKMYLIGGLESFSTDLGLKLNVGFKSSKIKFTFFATMAFNNLFKDMMIGVQLGIGF